MAERKPRTDSLRNRTRLLEEAKAAFSEKGSGASLEAIARAAGVGIGTLYRHFPTRDALIEAVYRAGERTTGRRRDRTGKDARSLRRAARVAAAVRRLHGNQTGHVRSVQFDRRRTVRSLCRLPRTGEPGRLKN